MKGNNQYSQHELTTIKLHGKLVQILTVVYKEPLENSKIPVKVTK